MKTHTRKILKSVIAVIMAVVMGAISPMQVFAGGRIAGKITETETDELIQGKKYIKEIIIVTESEKDQADADGYIVLPDAISYFEEPEDKKEHGALYFAIKTTENPNEAIVDIKAMNMHGNYSFEEYKKYIEELKVKALYKADQMLIAVKEFAANYKNDKSSAAFACKMLNYFVSDDEVDENGENTGIPLGDFFTDERILSEEKYQKEVLELLQGIVMKSNGIILSYIRQLILYGCMETTETTLADQLLAADSVILASDMGGLYNEATSALIDSMGETQRAIKAYKMALDDIGTEDDVIEYLNTCANIVNKEEQAELTEEDLQYFIDHPDVLEAIVSENKKKLENKEKISENIDLILAGKTLSGIFGNVTVNFQGNNETLEDIVMKSRESVKTAELAPFAAMLSPGQLALAGLGFDKLVFTLSSDCTNFEDEMANFIEYWDTTTEDGLISVYDGVDLSLFDPNGIAMVGNDVDFSTSGADKFLGIGTTAASIMLGSSVFGITAGALVLRSIVSKAPQVIAPTAVDAATTATNVTSAVTNAATMTSEYATEAATWAMVTYKNFTTPGGFGISTMGASESAAFADGFAYGLRAASRNVAPADFMNSLTKAYSPAFKETATVESAVANEAVTTETVTMTTGQIVGKILTIAVIVLSIILLIASIVTLAMDYLYQEEYDTYTEIPRILVTMEECDETYDTRYEEVYTSFPVFYKGIVDPYMSDSKAQACNTPSKVMDVFDWSLTRNNREWIALYATDDGRVGNPIVFDDEYNTLVILREDEETSYDDLEESYEYNGRVDIFKTEYRTECGEGVIIFNHDMGVTSSKQSGFTGSITVTNGKFIFFILLAVTVGAGIGVGTTVLVGYYRKKQEKATV